MSTSHPSIPALVLTAFLGFASSGHAQEEDSSERVARAQFQLGETLYSEGQFEEAATAFQEAYDASGRRELLYNLYLAWRDARRDARAADALERYLHAMEGEELDNRVLLERRLSALREAPDADVEQVPIDLGHGMRQPRSPSIVPWVVVGVGAAALVVGGITGVLALSKESDLLERCPERDCPELQSEADGGRRLARTTDALLIGGAIVTGAGIVWAVLDRRRARADGYIGTNWSCTPDGCLGSLEGRF